MTPYWWAWATGWDCDPFEWWTDKVSPEREGMERAGKDYGEGSEPVRSQSTGGTG